MGHESVDKVMKEIDPAWILMFYSMPSKPERNRLRIYRRLQKEGTLSLKDGVHILPLSDDRYEFFQWLSKEIKGLDGEMNFVVIEKIEMMENIDVIALFQAQAEASYSEVEQKIRKITVDLSLLEDKVDIELEHTLRQMLKKVVRDFDLLYKIDYFYSSKGKTLKTMIQNIQSRFESDFEMHSNASRFTIPLYEITHYKNKTWQTRTNPFVDRMASAWLISKQIDSNAKFIFSDTINASNPNIITYDMNEAIFTHIGDLCTFEVLLKSFGIEDDILNAIAKLVHTLDINDDKYISPQADGIKLILSAIRSSSFDDYEILKKSGEIFDYLYLAFADG